MTTGLAARLIGMMGIVLPLLAWAAGTDRPSEYTNRDTIINTRHNFTGRSAAGVDLLAGGPNAGATSMFDISVNTYGQVCVFCHTPHGSNPTANAPLWNRNLPSGGYTTYDTLGTQVTQTYGQPGGASLVCLSCHDGQQAIDAIINMPGPGNYKAVPDTGFLNTWAAYGPSTGGSHMGLNDLGCLICHSNAIPGFMPTATDFTVFVIGKDLRDDHPVGVTYPGTTGPGTDWKTPGGSKLVAGLTTRFFDDNGNGRLDKGDIRLYGAVAGATVECGSCHDPHGVPGPGGTFYKSFMRKDNSGSALCLTCHVK